MQIEHRAGRIEMGVKIYEDYEIRHFGFSDTGRNFVIAVSRSLFIYSRS